MKILIVGGVAGGASTATRLRRNDENAEIIMFERGDDISYANCGIPYHIGGVIEDRDELVLVTKKDFKKKLNVDVKLKSEVVAIDRIAKKIKIFDKNNNNYYEENYDKLVLSPGGHPVRPEIPGIHNSNIFTVRNLVDMDSIIANIKTHEVKRAIVVGAGFIGLELAENLAHLGIQVSIVELAGQVMNLLDYEMSTFIHQHLHTKKVGLYLNDAVVEFKEEKNHEITAILKSGRKIESNMVILSIGVRPEIKLAKEANLEIGKLGGIRVNNFMETSDKNIYALGDVIEITDIVSGKPALIPLANSANKQGRIVADNICGKKIQYKGTPGTAIAKVFDLTVGITGNSEKQLKKFGINYDRVYLQPPSHAGYYPNSFPMVFKLIYDKKTHLVLGAQIIGIDGVDKRIDVMAGLIQFKKTVFDLAELELAYAPPYGSAKDPVNLAGMIAINKIQGKNPTVCWDEIDNLIKEKAVFVDVRSKMEFELGHIQNAINIPLAEIREKITEIKKLASKNKVILYCNQGKTAYFALSILLNLGIKNVFNLNGGYKIYHTTTLKQENTDIFDNYVVDKKDDVNTVKINGDKIIKINACGLQCPGPIMKLNDAIQKADDGDIIELETTDYGFKNDVGVWCERTGNKLISIDDIDRKLVAKIQKGALKSPTSISTLTDIPHDKTMVMFSNNLDKALASFIIANGAVAMGRKVTMFFTFWGLNILRQPKSGKIKKTILESMFGKMMPKGSKKLALSQMNMFGIGPALIKHIMKNKNVDSLEILIKSALDSGVKLVACQMSMDLMGIKKEELIEGVEIGGVASYLGAAELADTNLFI